MVALAIGFLNGLLVMKTGLPSFIVTLGTFFVLRGVNLAVTKLIIDQVSVVDFQRCRRATSPAQQLFGSFVKIDLGWLPWVDADRTRHLTIYAATFWAHRRRRHRHLDPAAHARRQLDLRRRWRPDQRPAGRRACASARRSGCS